MSFSALKQKFTRFYYARKIKSVAASCEGRVYVGGKSYVTFNTYLADNVCFNGMAMSGNGKIAVGANFHSGPGCQIITSFHDYDHDDAIPLRRPHGRQGRDDRRQRVARQQRHHIGGGNHRGGGHHPGRQRCLQEHSRVLDCGWASGRSVQAEGRRAL